MTKLKELRTQAEMSQFELAVKVGVTPRYIGFLESGDRSPSIKVAKRIADYFETSIEDIFLSSEGTERAK